MKNLMFVSWKNINLKLQQSINHLDVRQENGKTALIWVILNLLPVWNLYGLASWNAWLWRMAWRDVVINLLIRMTGVVWTWVFSESSFGLLSRISRSYIICDDVWLHCLMWWWLMMSLWIVCKNKCFYNLWTLPSSPSTQRYQ